MASIKEMRDVHYVLALSEKEAEMLCRLIGNNVAGIGLGRNELNNIFYALDTVVPLDKRGTLSDKSIYLDYPNDETV